MTLVLKIQEKKEKETRCCHRPVSKMDALESLKGYGSDSSSDEETSSQRDR